MEFSGSRELRVIRSGSDVYFKELHYSSIIDKRRLENLLEKNQEVDYHADLRVIWEEDSVEILTSRGVKSYVIQKKELRKLKELLK